ncbi:MAG: hypothetical protein GEU79_10400 [Acidimicrobiia bacterium]|nr:hypothetical protein [Acidimicrobiia bacterium]
MSRGEMAVFIQRAFQIAQSQEDRFADDTGHYAENAIDAVANAGITVGCNPPKNTRFCPLKPITRSQVATFIMRGLRLNEESPQAATMDSEGNIGDFYPEAQITEDPHDPLPEDLDTD